MADAADGRRGQVGTLFFAYAQLGLHNWLDMRQALLTLEGMRQGVRDSDVFLLVLTETVLGRPYCQEARHLLPRSLPSCAAGRPSRAILAAPAPARAAAG